MPHTVSGRFVFLSALVTLGLFIYGHTFLINSDNQLASLLDFKNEEYLTVAFLDVGQGDAIFIETPDGVQALIDGGPNNAVLRELGGQMSILDRHLDLVIATHPDKDHVGGLIDVLNRYKVDNVVTTSNKSDTVTADVFDYTLSSENALVSSVKAGQSIQLGETVSLQVLSPLGDVSEWESNTSSIVVKLTYKDIDFMLTGDAPKSIESYLTRRYSDSLESEVLKLSHHGSKTSTEENFLATVNPEYAVISAGYENRYGHPHQEVVERVKKTEAEILSTISMGTIVFVSDGQRVWVEK